MPATVFGRFNVEHGTTVLLQLVEPIVVEVSADAAWNGLGFRHVLRCMRLRPDAEVASVAPPEFRVGH